MTFLLGLILSTAQAFDMGYNINIEDYNKNNKWYKKPDIMICKDAIIKKEDLKIAIDAWEKEGIKVGKIVNEKSKECDDDYEKGYILIMAERDLIAGTSHHAITQRWYLGENNGKRNVVSAYIEIKSMTVWVRPDDMPALLTHELGHAFGYKHVESNNDIMHPGILSRY